MWTHGNRRDVSESFWLKLWLSSRSGYSTLEDVPVPGLLLRNLILYCSELMRNALA